MERTSARASSYLHRLDPMGASMKLRNPRLRARPAHRGGVGIAPDIYVIFFLPRTLAASLSLRTCNSLRSILPRGRANAAAGNNPVPDGDRDGGFSV